MALPGVPDLLGYNKNHFFFTLELKISVAKKVRFSPHQIAFHKTHPKNTFILVKSLAPSLYKLYRGSQIEELVARGLMLDACCSGLDACCLTLDSLGAWCLRLEAWVSLLEARGLRPGASSFLYSTKFVVLYIWSAVRSTVAFGTNAGFLVLAICYVPYFWIPTRSAIAARIVLIWSRTSPASCYYSWCMGPALRRRLINHRHWKPNH